MISLIIPAYNEEKLLPRTLETARAALQAAGEPFEIVVVNDASSDHTAGVAREFGARVLDVHHRHIAAVRNAGAREAHGDLLLFLDADTLICEAVVRGALAAIKNGAAGGGARVQFDERTPFLAQVFAKVFMLFWFGMRWAAGCCVFARRDAFWAAGGFDEKYFVSEEMHLSRALKRQGRFVILKSRVITSGRKTRMLSFRELMQTTLGLLIRGPRAWRKRENLGFWYDGRRE